MKKIIVIVMLIVSSNVFSYEQWNVQTVGRKLVVSPNRVSGEIVWNDNGIDDYCSIVEDNFKDMWRDYRKYDCLEDNEISMRLCKVIRSRFNKVMDGDYTFGKISNKLSFLFDLKKSVLSKSEIGELSIEYGVPFADIVVLQLDLDEKNANSWVVQTIDNKNFFLDVYNTLVLDNATISNESGISGIVENNFVACAIKQKAATVSRKFKCGLEVKEEYYPDRLVALYSTYSELMDFWKEKVDNNYKNGTYVLLHLGAQMKKIRKTFLFADLSIGTFEHWLDNFFKVSFEGKKINIVPKIFNSILEFENALYPATKHDVHIVTELVEES